MLDLEDQYDKIFRYLYFHFHDRHMAEDLTQETFLRFLSSRTYRDENRQLQYLYTIARNLSRQYYRDQVITYTLDTYMLDTYMADTFTLEEQTDIPSSESFEQPLLEQMMLRDVLQKLPPEERELLFLRYVNDVPVSVISGMYKISRFAVYRKLKNILKRIRLEMEMRENG